MPHDPHDVPCHWCGEPSVLAIEQKKKVRTGWVPTAMFIYVCAAHETQGRELEYVKKR